MKAIHNCNSVKYFLTFPMSKIVKKQFESNSQQLINEQQQAETYVKDRKKTI